MITDAQGHLTTAIHLRNAASKGKSGRIIPLNKELKAVLQLLHKQAAPSPYVITTERSGQFSSAAIVKPILRLVPDNWSARLLQPFWKTNVHHQRRA